MEVTIGRRSLLLGAAFGLASRVPAADRKTYPVEMKTLAYAKRGGGDLLLDLYLPQSVPGRVSTILFLHGGGWSAGTRTTGPDFKRFFAQDGFAVASIEYRLTPFVRFPSNAEDVKTAIRWVRGNADGYGLNKRVGIWGTSAGGHLSAVAALTPRGVFEGDGNADQSSEVECVLDAYGPSSLLVMDAQTDQEKPLLQQIPAALAANGRGGPGTMARHDAAESAESKLIGAPIQTAQDLARAASPIAYVRAGAPPFLLMHGLADNSVPHHQSVLMYQALAAAGNEVTLRLVDGLPHTFFNRSNLDEIAGPFRMDVFEHPKGGVESRGVERAGVFDVAREFFRKHLA
ncbi:MAG TPA: alpha/beta hydrolase [Bryobacteraceae bacterium]|nr:alpha/beta hydrolase [Bryobacteraceae bacterium]